MEDPIMGAKFRNAKVLKNFLECVLIKSVCVLTFSKEGIHALNCSVNNMMIAEGKIDEESIDMKWREYTGPIHLGVTTKNIKAAVNEAQTKENFDIELYKKSDTTYMLSISKSGADEQYKKAQCIVCNVSPPPSIVFGAPTERAHRLIVPVEFFTKFMKGSRKGKTATFQFIYLPNQEKYFRDNDIVLFHTSKDREDEYHKYGTDPDIVLDYDAIDDCFKFPFVDDNLPYVKSFGALQKDGSIVFYYEEGRDLRLKSRIGSYGEVSLYFPCKS